MGHVGIGDGGGVCRHKVCHCCSFFLSLFLSFFLSLSFIGSQVATRFADVPLRLSFGMLILGTRNLGFRCSAPKQESLVVVNC